jgi:prepilin-type N-terminal cleavage/methylation domain-containing protein
MQHPAENHADRRRAFSLVELSIVLVILGLLVGGILSGQALIRAAELRSVATDLSKYQTALYTFRDKYFAIPGDMVNATSFWGTATVCPGGTGSGTCNGNGDGIITNVSGNIYESIRAWQHLVNAGLIEGNYTGAWSYIVIGTNVPKSKVSPAGFGIISFGPTYGSAYCPDLCWPNQSAALALEFGTANSVFDTPRTAAIKAEDAWNIDTKLDDGKPYMGSIMAGGAIAGWSSCVTTTAVPSEYNVTSTSIACPLTEVVIR